jgi:hypothetical protein
VFYRIESLNDKPEAPDPADQLPAIQDQAISRLTDLWLLGRHRVLCGNALEQSAYAILMENAKAQLVFTDPPYNVPIQGHVSGLGSVHHREFPMASGEMSEIEFERFLLTCFRHLRLQPAGQHALHLHRLASSTRASGCRHRDLWKPQQFLCLGEIERRHGLALSQPA